MEVPFLPYKEYREKLGLSIEDVCLKTKIRQHVIEALEENNFSILPPVYITAFIRTYATFLKLPQKDVEATISEIKKKTNIDFESSNQIVQTKQSTDKAPINLQFIKNSKFSKLNRDKIVNYLVYTGLGLAIISLLYFTFFYSSSNSSSGFKGDNDKKIKGPDTAYIGSQEKGLLESYTSQDSILLEARGIDTSWIRIVIDGAFSNELVMTPNIERQWRAKNFFILFIGKEGAVEFKRDGQVLPPFGAKGSVIRNAKIMRDKIVVASSPWDGDTTIKRRVRKPAVKQEPPIFLEPSPVKKSYQDIEEKKPPPLKPR